MKVDNSSRARILVVDDEENIISFIKMGLTGEGYEVFTCYSGTEAVERISSINPDLIILDIMLPGMDGYEVCSIIKSKVDIPIIMLTAMDEIDEKVKGLEIGADDYMVKPFSFKELLARINARLRDKAKAEKKEGTTYNDFSINDSAHEIYYRGNLLKLSLTEYKLLKYLLLNSGIVLSKSLILEKVWGYDFNGEDNIVEVYIRYLREKLGDKSHSVITTVRGVGYKVVIR